MEIYIGAGVLVKAPVQEIVEYCNQKLILDNPEYVSRLQAGRWLGNTPRKLCLYERNGDYIHMPYGCKNDIIAIGTKHDAKITWEKYPEIERFKAEYNSNITLYDYQQGVVEAMIKAVNGVVIMPCGSGKTQTALEVVSRLGLKTLWLTHTQDLLNQSMERAKSCFECGKEMFGAITAGRVNISKGITFATVQTMCRINLQMYANEWAVIVVDECQHLVGTPTRMTQFYQVISNLYAPYKFGLTATPNRTDGLEQSMYALLGGKIAEVDRSCVANTTCPVKIEAIDTGYFPNTDDVLNGDGTINYTALVADLTNNHERFLKAVTIINTECRSYSIVLANRVAYLQNLCNAYAGKAVCLSTMGTSKKAKEERKEALRRLNSGEIDCIFATYQLAAEGLDCPNLRHIVFATPEKNERLITQAVGRVARKADFKAYGTVIDLVDDFGMFKGWAKRRMNIYKKLGCEVI